MKELFDGGESSPKLSIGRLKLAFETPRPLPAGPDSQTKS
jgi:hypothetical protein